MPAPQAQQIWVEGCWLAPQGVLALLPGPGGPALLWPCTPPSTQDRLRAAAEGGSLEPSRGPAAGPGLMAAWLQGLVAQLMRAQGVECAAQVRGVGLQGLQGLRPC